MQAPTKPVSEGALMAPHLPHERLELPIPRAPRVPVIVVLVVVPITPAMSPRRTPFEFETTAEPLTDWVAA